MSYPAPAKSAAINCLRSCLIATIMCSFASIAQAAFVPFDLTNWTVEQYSTGGGGNQVWGLQGANAVRTSNNGNSSMFLSDFSIDHSLVDGLQGTIQVNSGDDDQIGVVWGHQDRGDFYLFQWKKGAGQLADQGMNIRKMTAGMTDPTLIEFEGADVPGDNSILLASNDEEWFSETTTDIVYEWTLAFLTDGFRFSVKETIGGSNTLLDVIVNDVTYTTGKFGFYNASQPFALYDAGYLQPIPVPPAALLFSSALGLLAWRRRRAN